MAYHADFHLDDLVPDSCICPNCEENRMDYLVWQDEDNTGDTLLCHSCEFLFQPHNPPMPINLKDTRSHREYYNALSL